MDEEEQLINNGEQRRIDVHHAQKHQDHDIVVRGYLPNTRLGQVGDLQQTGMNRRRGFDNGA